MQSGQNDHLVVLEEHSVNKQNVIKKKEFTSWRNYCFK